MGLSASTRAACSACAWSRVPDAWGQTAVIFWFVRAVTACLRHCLSPRPSLGIPIGESASELHQ